MRVEPVDVIIAASIGAVVGLLVALILWAIR